MKPPVAFVLAAEAILLLAMPGVALGDRSAVTPVQKVVTLLTEMLQKGQQEKHAEQVQFAAYKQFCDDTTVEKQRSIKAADEAIEMLKADIQKAVADAAALTKEVAQLDADISVWTGDMKAATRVREIERADYQAMHKDYSESVDAIQRAIAVLKKQIYDRKQAKGTAALAEISALKGLRLISEKQRRAIDTFLMQDPEATGLSVSAPEANAYEFQSHGIVEMIEKLLDKFIDERTSLEKAEKNAGHAFELLLQDLKAQTEQASTDRGEKAGRKAKRLQEKADAEGDLVDTSTTREEDHKYLTDLSATCETKASDYESRQQLRSEELQAIGKAVEILSGSAVSGAAEKHLPTLLQGRRVSSMAQLRSHSGGQGPAAQERVASFLRRQARQLNSRVLSALAVRVADDPFSKVKKMIKDLIVRLMEEANEEAEHKGWCDTELATNEQTRKEKTAEVETLHAEMDELEASISKLTEDVANLAKEISELDAAMAKSTTMRQEEKATNAATVKDAEDAQAAVAQALIVLREFYAKAGEATALVQHRAQLRESRQVPPPIFDSPYQGMAAEHGGVVGLLEVIESDFARLQTDTEAAEATAQKTYDEFMTDSKVLKAQKSKDVQHKTLKKQDEQQALTAKGSDLEGTQKMLDAALSYYDKLKPSCVDAGVSYDDRVTRRKEEIQSLQEALRILNGEDLA